MALFSSDSTDIYLNKVKLSCSKFSYTTCIGLTKSILWDFIPGSHINRANHAVSKHITFICNVYNPYNDENCNIETREQYP